MSGTKKENDESDKRLSRAQQEITTIQTAWELFLPASEMPRPGHIAGWLALASVSEILSLMQEASERPDLRKARYWVWDRLRLKTQASVSA